jgi:hypothetical protein
MLQAVNPNNKQLAERANKVAEMRSKVIPCFNDGLLSRCHEASSAMKRRRNTGSQQPWPPQVLATWSCRSTAANMRCVLYIAAA